MKERQQRLLKNIGNFFLNIERDEVGVLKNLANVTVTGQENYAAIASGPAILNLYPHSSDLDPYLVRGCLPPVVSHHTFFAAKASRWGSGPESRFGKLVTDFIPLDTDASVIPLHSMREILKRLKNGEYLAISAEGTRTLKDANKREFKEGVAWLLKLMNYSIPVVPIIIVGAGDILPKGAKIPNLFERRGEKITRRRIFVHVAEPIRYQSSGQEKSQLNLEKESQLNLEQGNPLKMITANLLKKSNAIYKELYEAWLATR